MSELLSATSLSIMMALWTIILLASILRAFTGFGFALCAVPGFSLFLPATDSAVLSVMLTLGINILTIRSYVGEYPPKSMSLILVMALLGTVAGNQVLLQIDQNLFRIFSWNDSYFCRFIFVAIYTEIASKFEVFRSQRRSFRRINEWCICHPRASDNYLRHVCRTRSQIEVEQC